MKGIVPWLGEVRGMSPNGQQLLPRKLRPEDDSSGARLARLVLNAQGAGVGDSIHTTILNGVHDTDDLCLVFRGGQDELIRLNFLEFR